MEFKDYYNTLGVEPSADSKAIKSAYRKLARKYHPDVSKEEKAEEKFKEISEAYEVLKHVDKRAEYDELRKYRNSEGPFKPPPGWQARQNWQASAHASDMHDFSDFFRSIFGDAAGESGGGRRHDFRADWSARGQDVEMELPVFLEDTLSEHSREIEYQIPAPSRYEKGVTELKRLKVKIPAGVNDGERIRLVGVGVPGSGNAPNGDLYLRVRLVPHPLFDVEGHNLILILPVSPWEAALGSRVIIPTLGGKAQLTVLPNSQAGSKLRLRNKGLANGKQFGDLIVVLKIVMPDDPQGTLNPLWEKLAEAGNFSPRSKWEEQQQ